MAGKMRKAKLFTTHPETGLERTVREELTRLGYPFEKEKRVGIYTVDYCVGGLLVVECDGGAWHPETLKSPYEYRKLRKKQLRDAYLRSLGYTVLHFNEKEIRGGTFKDPLLEAIIDLGITWQPSQE